MAFLDDLRAALPPGAVLEDPEVVGSYERDQAVLAPSGTALAVALPETTAHVQAVVRLAAAHGVPVVARGAGSGLAGGANAVDGCLVVSLARMNRILDVDPAGLTATVQPGVLNAELSRAVAAAGLWYPPDPASWEFSTIGGNVATNAGGLCCVKYGVTGDFVLALEVVLADGRAVRVGRGTVKGVAGYDLTALFVGSEGTLGIVTRVTVRLRPSAAPGTTLVASFTDLRATGEAISSITREVVPAMLELLDRATLRAVEDWKRMGLDEDAAALLIARSDVPGAPGAQEVARMQAACREAGASLVIVSDDPAEAEMLTAARRFAFPALERLGTTLLDDVAVPRGRIAELLAGIEAVAARRGVTIATFGHAGDGNMHPTLVFDGADEDAASAARKAFDDVVALALDLGGTVTGEHGVGVLKREHLRRELGEDGMDLLRAVKEALDPHGVLNPGKIL